MKNKYQEAFGDIVDNGVSLSYFNDKSGLPQDENPLFIVQELVDKETPMKRVYDERFLNGLCPVCYFNLKGYERCGDCGQCIDWSDEE